MRKAARKDLELKLGDARAAANMLQRRLDEATHKAQQEAASQAAQLSEHKALTLTLALALTLTRRHSWVSTRRRWRGRWASLCMRHRRDRSEQSE